MPSPFEIFTHLARFFSTRPKSRSSISKGPQRLHAAADFSPAGEALRAVSRAGPLVEQDRSVGPFHALAAAGAFEIHWSAGPPALKVIAPSNLQGAVAASVSEAGELSLRIQGEAQSSSRIVIECSSPSLSAATLSGSCDFKATTAPLIQPRISLSGSSSCQANFIGAIEAELSGSSQAFLHGLGAYGARFELRGSSRLEALGGEAVGARVEASGSSTAKLCLSGSCSVRASGAAQIKYSGSPAFCSRAVSGAGSISPIKGPAPR